MTYEELADEGLIIWDETCTLLGIKHFLVHGTCLLIYRDGRISCDDIDVGVTCSDDEFLILIEKLSEKGFIEPSLAREISGIKMKFDLVNKYHPSELGFMETLDTVNYKGRAYNIPNPVEDYLELHYGYYGDWRIPIGRYAPSRLVRTGAYKPVKHLWFCA